MGHRACILIENGRFKIVSISNSDFSRNIGSLYGFDAVGALSVFTFYLELYNTTFVNNTGSNGGALAVHNIHSIVNISRCNFIDNRAAYRGGAVYIQQSTFSSNEAGSGGGGAIYVNGNNNHILIEQSSLNNNKALAGSGGAVHTNGQNTSILISESTISKNSAASCGALAINDFQHYNIKFENSMFVNNLATTNSGGVLCIRNGSISVDNCTFSHNRAAGNAGVFAVDDSTVTIHSSTFDNNTAGANGGVVAIEYFRTALFISHTSFTNNQGAKQGGVMYVGRKGSQVKISRSTIDFNNASRGGFATILGSSLEITTTNIFNNTAESGKVISACTSDITVSDQLLTSTDPTYSVCTLFNGDIN